MKNVFTNVGVETTYTKLGEVETINVPTPDQFKKIKAEFADLGFELLDDDRKREIEKIKTSLIELIQTGGIQEHFSLSKYLSAELHSDYSRLSRLFSEVEGITIEQFYILQKVERIKELMMYDEQTVSEIAWKLGYSSVAHLSNQFKKITGLSPSEFKKLRSGRKSLDRISGRA